MIEEVYNVLNDEQKLQLKVLMDMKMVCFNIFSCDFIGNRLECINHGRVGADPIAAVDDVRNRTTCRDVSARVDHSWAADLDQSCSVCNRPVRPLRQRFGRRRTTDSDDCVGQMPVGERCVPEH